jgi:tetratricopeptide (TPR) repeat protein
MMRRLSPYVFCLLLAACASQASPEDAQMSQAMCTQGKTLLSAHKYTDAQDIYASAIKRDSHNARAWNGLGVSEDFLGKHDEAIDAYQHAIDLDPKDLSATNNLAHLYIETGKPDEALHLLEPYANDASIPQAMQQNLIASQQGAKLKQGGENEVYADLGSYPTEGMAQGHFKEIRWLLDDDKIVLTIVPEVKTGGGIPVFTIKATGRSPQSICEDMNAKAFPCVAHGK